MYSKKLYHDKKLGLEFLAALVVMSNKILSKELLKEIWEDVVMLQVFKHAEEIGMEKGFEKGIEKNKEKTAVNMLKEGMEVKLIAKLTELPEEEVLRLKKELEKS